MTNTLMVTPDELRDFVGLSDHIEETYLRTAIRNMQEIEIKPILSTNLFDDIISDLENNTLSGNNQTLLNDYIKPALSYYALSNVMYELSYKITRKGLQTQLDDGSEKPSDEMVAMRAQQYKDLATSYANNLIDYLNEYKDTYALYGDDDVKASRRTGAPIFTSYYKRTKRTDYN